MKLLQDFLSLIAPAAPMAGALLANGSEPAADHASTVAVARDQLRAAHAGRDRARQALQRHAEATARVKSLISEAQTADAVAKAAADRLAAATRAWAEAGALGDLDDGPQHTAAREAAQAAFLARARAQGAEDGLAACEMREREARYELNPAEDAVVTAALNVVLTEKAEPLLRKLEHASAEFHAAREALQPLRLLTHIKWIGTTHEFAPFQAPDFAERMHACDPELDDDGQFIKRLLGPRDSTLYPAQRSVADTWSEAHHWKQLVYRLCDNPDALLDE